jgi:hypothetical protein
VESDVKTSVSKSNTCKTSNSKEEEESYSKKPCWVIKIDRSTSPSSNSAKNLDTSRNRNDPCRSSKVCTSVHVKSYSIPVVGSYDKSKNTNRYPSVYPSKVTKNWLSRVSRYHLTYNTESWKNKNVHFRVSEESEKVLIKNWVTSSCWIVETSVKVTVSKKPCNCTCEYWKRKEQKESCYENRSYKEWKLVPKKTWSAPVKNCNDKVNGSKN